MDSAGDVEVVLALCPTWTADKPLIGQAYLLAALRKAGVRCRGLDLNIEFYNDLTQRRPDIKSIWGSQAWRVGRAESALSFMFPERLDPLDALCEDIGQLYRDGAVAWADRILALGPRVVGFTVMGNTAIASLMTARELRRRAPDVRVIFGGPGCHEGTNEEIYLASGWVDAVVMGEGEQALLELLPHLLGKGPIPALPGTKVRDGDTIRRGPDRTPLKDLEQLAIPDYDDFDPDTYYGAFDELSLLLSRGCVARCTFCADYPFWGRWRTRPGRAVAEEMLTQHQRYGTSQFFFADLVLNGARREVEAMCDHLLDVGADFHWGGNARVLPMLPPALLEKMRRAGCSFLHYGLEHGVQSVLDAMDKRMSVEQYERALQYAHDAEIPVSAGFIAGHPAEGEDEFIGMLDFVARNFHRIHQVHCQQLALISGSEMTRDAQRFDLELPGPFPLPDDLAWLRGYEYPMCSGWRTKDGRNHEALRVERTDRFHEFVEQMGKEGTRHGIGLEHLYEG
jgi:anaerobic magnesium-protoporphyrin IX monomethyl ester cyclase